jgi:hypothetical protein
MKKQTALATLIFLFLTSSAWAGIAPCTTSTKSCEAVFPVVPNGKVTYTRSFDLDTPNEDVTSAILMIHASDRKISWGYDQLNTLIAQHLLSPDTLIVAPLLNSTSDKPAPGWLFWEDNGWSGGFDSIDGTATSSYFVIDQFIKKILSGGNFPNLKTFIITGFSAGGQATQRFALGTDVDREFPQIHFRYIVASPSSYAYLNADRWVPGTEYQFAVPINPGCAYNSYRYGGENPNSYMSKKAFSILRDDFIAKDLVLIVGENDDATTHPNPPINDGKDAPGLDISCEARWQGASRLQRSFLFHQYLSAEFPQNKHIWFSVPGAAHSYVVYDDPRTIDLLNFRY